jgi:putative membrane protein
MRLVVCVDRDDDLGRKAGIKGPVLGREGVIEAATKLAVADPEDADTNAMFAAVRLVDELRKAGETSEVCVLTGSPKVGRLSDQKVAEQFDLILSEVKADSAHLVSDGAEDEFLFPILASRLRIDGVHRVYIRQSANLESTYFLIVRALKDPKLRAKTVLPLALILLILGISAGAGLFLWGVIGLAIILGIYLVFWTFDIDEAMIDGLRSASTDVRQGSMAFGFGLVAIGLVGVGFLAGYDAYTSSPSAAFGQFLSFLNAAIVWWILGALVWEVGRALRRYVARRQFPRSFFVATTSILGVGLLSYGVVSLLEYLQGLGGITFRGLPVLPLTIVLLVAGLALEIAAAALQQRFKAMIGGPVGEPVST